MEVQSFTCSVDDLMIHKVIAIHNYHFFSKVFCCQFISILIGAEKQDFFCVQK